MPHQTGIPLDLGLPYNGSSKKPFLICGSHPILTTKPHWTPSTIGLTTWKTVMFAVFKTRTGPSRCPQTSHQTMICLDYGLHSTPPHSTHWRLGDWKGTCWCRCSLGMVSSRQLQRTVDWHFHGIWSSTIFGWFVATTQPTFDNQLAPNESLDPFQPLPWPGWGVHLDLQLHSPPPHSTPLRSTPLHHLVGDWKDIFRCRCSGCVKCEANLFHAFCRSHAVHMMFSPLHHQKLIGGMHHGSSLS